MDSYFFVPADQEDKLLKTTQLDADFFIADLEDSVQDHNYNRAIENLISSESPIKIDFLRIDPSRLRSDSIHEELFSSYNNIIYPKISNASDFQAYLSFTATYKTKNILIVEHPWLMVNMNMVIQHTKNDLIGLAFGNHDYSAQMDVRLDSEIIDFARKHIVTFARAYGLKAIDVASMELQDKERFEDEAKYGYELGFGSKLLIHPRQLEWLNNMSFYSEEEVAWAKKIVHTIAHNDGYALSVVDGKVVERPHIIKAKKILKHESVR